MASRRGYEPLNIKPTGASVSLANQSCSPSAFLAHPPNPNPGPGLVRGRLLDPDRHGGLHHHVGYQEADQGHRGWCLVAHGDHQSIAGGD